MSDKIAAIAINIEYTIIKNNEYSYAANNVSTAGMKFALPKIKQIKAIFVKMCNRFHQSITFLPLEGFHKKY